MKSLVFILSVPLLLASCHPAPPEQAAARVCYEAALEALERDSIQKAERMLRQAIGQARDEDDLHTCYLAQLRLAQLMAEGNSAGALCMAQEALATYRKRPDSPRNHIILLDFIATYASQVAFNDGTSYDESLAYAEEAHTLAQASSDTMGTELLSQTLTTRANIKWAMERYPEAVSDARQAVRCAPESLLLGAQQVLARCLFSCDSLQEAEAVYRQMQPGSDLQVAYIIQSNLAKLALRKGDARAAEDAFDEAFEHAEDLYFDALQQKDQYYQTLLAEERENQRLRYAGALQRRTLWAALAVLLAILAATVSMFYARSKMSAQRRLADAWSRKHEVDELIHQAQLHREHQIQLEREAAAQGEQLRQRDAAIAFLQEFVLQRSSIIQKLGYSNDRHIVLNDHEWREVERTLNAIDGDRFVRLRQRFPDMREEDIQLCILTRLRLSNRAIGNIYAISVSAVQHRKLKIKKDIFSQTDPDTTLEQVLSEV